MVKFLNVNRKKDATEDASESPEILFDLDELWQIDNKQNGELKSGI